MKIRELHWLVRDGVILHNKAHHFFDPYSEETLQAGIERGMSREDAKRHSDTVVEALREQDGHVEYMLDDETLCVMELVE